MSDDQRLDDAARQAAGFLDGDPFRQGRRLSRRTGVLAAHQPVHRRVERRLHADNFDPRRERLGRHRYAGDQAATADRHDDRVEIGLVGEEFEGDRPLPGDHRWVVVGVDKAQTAFAGKRLCGYARGSKAIASEHDGGAKSLGMVDLDKRRALGHDDRRRDGEALCVIGDTLGVVAGRHRDDAGAALLGAQGQQLVQGAALLERAGAMQGFELKVNFGADEFGQYRGGDGRRVRDGTRDRRSGLADVGDRHRQISHACGPKNIAAIRCSYRSAMNSATVRPA